MIKSCEECKTKCCKFGPGPYKTLQKEAFLENYSYAEGYNTKCENLARNGKCKIWGTSEFPIECRTHVCSIRSFTREELRKIEVIVDHDDGWGCPRCGCSWHLQYGDGSSKYNLNICEICRHEWTWVPKRRRLD